MKIAIVQHNKSLLWWNPAVTKLCWWRKTYRSKREREREREILSETHRSPKGSLVANDDQLEVIDDRIAFRFCIWQYSVSLVRLLSKLSHQKSKKHYASGSNNDLPITRWYVHLEMLEKERREEIIMWNVWIYMCTTTYIMTVGYGHTIIRIYTCIIHCRYYRLVFVEQEIFPGCKRI